MFWKFAMFIACPVSEVDAIMFDLEVNFAKIINFDYQLPNSN